MPITAITIDGSFSDWSSVPVAHSDADDVADSAGPDWLDIKIAADATYLYLYFSTANTFNMDGSPTYGFSQVLIFIDCDANALTGYDAGGGSFCGSELLANGANLFKQATGVFNDGFISALDAAPLTSISECEMRIPLSEIYTANPSATVITLTFLNDDVADYAPDFGSAIAVALPE
jgi:hypothetical protein